MRDIGVEAEAWAPFAEGRNNLFQNDVSLRHPLGHGEWTVDVPHFFDPSNPRCWQETLVNQAFRHTGRTRFLPAGIG